MADPKKISELAAASVILDTDVFAIASGGATLKALWSKIKSELTGQNIPGLVEQIDGHIETVADKEYVLSQNAEYAYDIDSFVNILASGTCTVEIAINGTAVGGLAAIAVTDAESTDAATAPFSVPAGAKVTLTVSSNSVALDLAFSIQTTRT